MVLHHPQGGRCGHDTASPPPPPKIAQWAMGRRQATDGPCLLSDLDLGTWQDIPIKVETNQSLAFPLNWQCANSLYYEWHVAHCAIRLWAA